MMNRLRRVLTGLGAWRGPRTLWIAAAILLALLAGQGARYLRLRHAEERITGLLRLQTAELPKRAPGKALEEYKVLTEKDLLGKIVKNDKLLGILGDAALYGENSQSAQEYRAGAVLPGGGKIVSVDDNSIVLEKDGVERTEYVFQELKQPKKPSREAPDQ